MMRTVRLLQTVVLMLLVAAAASCAASKDYSAKLFAPRNAPVKTLDSSTVALRFINIDTTEAEKANWVSTDLIMGRDTSTGTTALDNFSKSFPAVKKDSLNIPKEKELRETKGPVILAEAAKPVIKKEEPIARSYDNTIIRSKKTREE